MNCLSAVEMIEAAVDGVLSGPERSQLDAHLTGCEPCTRSFYESLSLRRLGRDWALVLTAESGSADVMSDRVLAAVANRAPGNRTRARREYGIALICMGALTVVFSYFATLFGNPISDSSLSFLPHLTLSSLTSTVFEPLYGLSDTINALIEYLGTWITAQILLPVLVVLTIVSVILVVKPSVRRVKTT